MKLNALLEEEVNFKAKALEFQQLILDNEHIHDLDTELFVKNHEIYVRVTHHEWTDLTFRIGSNIEVCNVGMSINFKNSVADDTLNDRVKDAVYHAIPYLIGEKAGQECIKSDDKFRYFVVEASDHDSDSYQLRIVMKDTEESMNSQMDNNFTFYWEPKHQCFSVDKEMYGDDLYFDTIKSMINFMSD